MPWDIIGALAAPIVGGIAGDIFGGSSPQATQAVPPQLQAMNQKSIQGLMTLLGFGGPNPWAPQQQQASGFGQPRAPGQTLAQQNMAQQGPYTPGGQWNPWGINPQSGMIPGMAQAQTPQMQGGQTGQGGIFGMGGPNLQQLFQQLQGGQGSPQMQSGQMGQSPLFGQMNGGAVGANPNSLPNGMAGNPMMQGPTGGMSPNLPGNAGAFLGGQGGMGMGSAGPINGGAGMSGSPMDQIFGNLGQPLTQLQQQSLGGMSQFMNQPAPEMQALQQSMPMLQNLLGNNPGSGVISALKPFMQQGLDMANQQGGRFGSANALRQSQVMNDYGLLAAQAAQQGVNQQLQGANQLGILSSAAGNNPFNRMIGGFNAGQAAAGQNDVGLQRALQLMSQAAFGQPTTVSPSGLQQGASIGGQVGQILAMLGGGMGGGQQAGTSALYNTPGGYGFTGGFGG